MRTTNRHKSVRTVLRLSSASLIFGLLLSACGGSGTFPDDTFAVVASSDIGTGPSRLQVGLIGLDGGRLGSPDERVSFELTPAGGEPVVHQADWIWLIEDVVGLYKVDVDFAAPGVWALRVLPDDGPAFDPVPFEVREDTFAPNIGEPAPIAPVDTLESKQLEDLTTDPDPDPDFYQATLEEAFTSGRKTVVVFATPAFCQTATCGPALDLVKSVKPEFPGVNFVHVEVYTDINSPGFAPTPEFLAPAVGREYWNLLSEPWVFVVDEAGVVSARFEGSLTADDLRTALGQ